MTESLDKLKASIPGAWRQRVDSWRRRLWWLATAVVVLVAVYVVVARELMGFVPDLKPRLEALLADRLGTHVTIAALEGRMDGLSPVFEMRQLRVEPDDDALAPFHIRRSELTVDLLPTLFNRRLQARSLLVEGVRLGLTRQPDGQFALQGLEALTANSSGGGPEPLLRLLYRQKRLVINELDLTLDWPDAPRLQFPDVELALVSSGESHILSARGTSVTEPMEFDVRLHMDGDAYTPQQVTGEGYVRIQGGDFAPWLASDAENPALSLERLGGRVEGWVSLRRGELRSATVELGLAALEMNGEWFAEPWRLDRSDMLLTINRRGEGYQAYLPLAQLQDDGGMLELPDLLVQWIPGQSEEVGTRWQVQAFDVQMASLQQWIVRQPVAWPADTAPLLDKLEAMEPIGRIEQLDVVGTGKQLSRFGATFEGIGLTAVEKTPGLRGLAGWVAGSPERGVMQIASPQVMVSLPRLYANQLIASLSGPLLWQHEDGMTDIHTGWLEVDNPDALGRLQATVRLRPETLPNLSLLASLTRGRGENVARYIPLRRLPEGASNWLAQAFVGGQVPEGRFLYEGPVRIDPNRQQDRTFEMTFRVNDVSLSYLPDWPVLESVNGDVTIDGRAIRGRGIDASIGDTALTGVVADIPEYENEQVPTVVVSGQVNGAAADVTTILHDTPLRDALPQEVSRWGLTDGQVSGHMLLHWPLPADAPGKMFIASTELTGATLASDERSLRFTGVNGPIFFHLDRGMFSSSLSGQFWGGEFQAGVATAGGRLSVTGQGAAQSAPMMTWLGQRPNDLATGAFSYQAALVLPWREEGDSFIEMSSDLIGVELSMPAPMSKSAQQPLSARVRVDFFDQPLVSLFADPLLRARIRPGETGLDAADLVFGDLSPVLPESGVRVRGELATLAVEPWIDWLDTRPEDGDDLALRNIDLRVAALDLLDFPVADSRLKVAPAGEDWRFSIASSVLEGSLVLPDEFTLRGNRPMVIDITRLILDSETGESSVPDPTTLPVADVTVNGIEVDGEDFGSWSMQWRPLPDGLSLESLDARWRHARFIGDAQWRVVDGVEQTHYVGRVRSSNLAGALRAWDVPTMVESDRSSAVVDLHWPGSPVDLDYLTTRGSVAVNIRDALIPNSDSRTNALRMLGIFNINAVSRRLRLDFSDVYNQGLSCDEISGDFEIEGPLVTTRNLVLDSPSAEFRISGTTNLDTEDLQQRVDVTLPTSSSLYLGCFAGPAACAGIFVVERLWGNKLEEMLTLSYSVTGSWNDPKVREMERER